MVFSQEHTSDCLLLWIYKFTENVKHGLITASLIPYNIVLFEALVWERVASDGV